MKSHRRLGLGPTGGRNLTHAPASLADALSVVERRQCRRCHESRTPPRLGRRWQFVDGGRRCRLRLNTSQQLGLPFICGPIVNPRVLLYDPRGLVKVVEDLSVGELLGVVEDSRNEIPPLAVAPLGIDILI